MKFGKLSWVVTPGLIAALLLIAGISLYFRASSSPDLRILWTNDTHGYLTPLYHREEGDDQFVERARREGRVGGFAYIASIVKRQRQELPDRTLLVDSGDTWHGTVVPVRLGGTPVVEVMNAMGYDAMVPGNVEMFYNQATLEKLTAAAKFPIVVANLYDAQWGERASLPNTRPYVIREINGLKVGIIGMTYHYMSRVSRQPQWSFGLRVAEVQEDINTLRQQHGVDLVVMLSHMGWKVDEKYAELVSGIDVIVGAHTHDTLYRPTLVYNKNSQRDVIVVQCGSHGKLLGQLDLTVRDKRVTAFAQTLFPVRAREVAPDPAIAALIEQYRAPYKAELERVIGETGTMMYRQATWQSTADNLLSDALRARTARDIALIQPSRYGATVLPGKITVEDIYNFLPDELPIYHMKFSGRDLRTMFEEAVDNIVDSEPLLRVGGNMWRFSGAEVAIDLGQPSLRRIQRMHIGGKPVKDKQLYSLAEFNMFFSSSPRAVDVVQTGKIGPHEIIAYIEHKKQVAPVLDHRITDHHGQIMADHEHLHEVREDSGRNDVDLDHNRVFQYRGKVDPNHRLVLEK
jgi:sulfur-oxidizing protein SoxB